MGNQLFGEYNIEKEPFLTGGYLNLWNIYRGIHKERKQNVCVFVFEKKHLDKFQKDEQNDILNSLKKEAQSLIKYKHPSILGIVEPLLEDKNSIGFVTEEFKYNLSSWVKSINPSKLEIKQMIIELCKVINFLHSDAHSIHTNFNPDNIFIDKDNKIKISGMNFAVNDPPLQGGEINVSSGATPNLSYCAPEIISHSKAFYSSDIFSIGCIIYNLLKFHKGDSDRNLLSLNSNTVLSYNNALSNMDNKLNKCNFENEDINLLNKILNKEPQYRPGIKELLDNEWFNDPKLKALNFIENLNANEQSKNIEFLQKLPRIISMFENKIIINRFLPCLLNALKNESLINSCLPAIFSICENTNFKLNFSNDVWPHLKDLFKLRALPAASIYFLISKVKYIGDNISNSEFTSSFLHLICKAMDCNVAKIQTVVAENLQYITKKIDSLAFKNQIYPRILQIIANTNSRPLKIEFLKKIKELYTKLDQNIINESLLNHLEKIRKADNNNEICMTIADIYEEIAKIVNIEGIANKILPNLISMLVGGNITKTNFDTIMKLVQTYLDRIRKTRFNDLADDANSIATTIMNNNNNNTNNNKSQEDNFMDSLLNQSNNNNNNNNKGNDKDDFLNSFFGNSQSFTSTLNNNNNNINGNESKLKIKYNKMKDDNMKYINNLKLSGEIKKDFLNNIKKEDSNSIINIKKNSLINNRLIKSESMNNIAHNFSPINYSLRNLHNLGNEKNLNTNHQKNNFRGTLYNYKVNDGKISKRETPYLPIINLNNTGNNFWKFNEKLKINSLMNRNNLSKLKIRNKILSPHHDFNIISKQLKRSESLGLINKITSYSPKSEFQTSVKQSELNYFSDYRNSLHNKDD